MKKIFIGVLIIVTTVCTVYAQFERGEKEISFSASFSSMKYDSSAEARTTFQLPLRIGFFYSNALEIEPEILLCKCTNENTGIILSGNLIYHICRTDPTCRFIPFLLGGIGFSNTMMLLPSVACTGDENEKWSMLNLGVGFKVLLPKPIAFRLDYRYQNFFGDVDITYHNIFMGFSVFLK